MSKNIILDGQTYNGVSQVELPVSGGTALFKDEDEIIVPTGTKQITANGDGIDVAEYAAVDVHVPTGGDLPTLTNPASAADILDGKEAIDGNGAKLTGTCTFDADTSDADAVASDIAQGKTAYVNGAKVVGTNTGGETIHYCAQSGLPYTAEMELTMRYNQYVIPAYAFYEPTYLESLIFHGYDSGFNGGTNLVAWADRLRVLKLPDYTGEKGTNPPAIVVSSQNIQEVELGKVGKPVKRISTKFYTDNGQYPASPTITIYVDAETLADVPTTSLSANAPWGFTDPTIIYRSSTTGEVLT